MASQLGSRLRSLIISYGGDVNQMATNLNTDVALDDLRSQAEAAVKNGSQVTLQGYQLLALLDELQDSQEAISDLEDELSVYYEAEATGVIHTDDVGTVN